MQPHELTALIRRHAGLIHKVAYAYCRNPTDREDVAQEVAVQLWRSADRYDTRCKETTWVYRIALNVAISFHRREHRHRERKLDVDVHAITLAAVPTPESDEHVELLRDCIDGLDPLEKALVLLYLDDNDHASIADVLGISVSNVGTKLGRIKTKLRGALDRRARANHTGGTHGTR